MNASSRGSNAAAALLRRKTNVCTSCRTSQSTRFYSAAPEAATPTSPIPEPPIAAPQKQAYRIKSGVILTRAPLLTRKLTPFENAYFFYQKRLNERLAIPFIHTLYFKRQTAAELDWQIKVAERDGIAGKDIGIYYPKGRNSWNDELLVGSTLSDEDRLRDILLKDAESRVTEDGDRADPDEIVPVERPMNRITEADTTNDLRRLDRKLDRTLYLVVKNGEGVWQFPTDNVPPDEHLHETAQRALEWTAGVNMNTWLVGRVPVAHMVNHPKFNEDKSLARRGEKVFFLKGRIMAGQATLEGNRYGHSDFNWLTREELKKKLPSDYFSAVRNMMPTR